MLTFLFNKTNLIEYLNNNRKKKETQETKECNTNKVKKINPSVLFQEKG